MERLTYVLDTNVISDRMITLKPIPERLKNAVAADHRVVLCQPVYYEVTRGLIKTNATRKLTLFRETIVPLLDTVNLEQKDWQQAADYWVTATGKGRQPSDMDLLIAAITTRLGGVLVSADADFDALSISRENWRETA